MTIETKEQAAELMGATVEKLDVKPGDMVKLNLPNKADGYRWTLGRIQMLKKALSARGAELVVVKEGATLEVVAE